MPKRMTIDEFISRAITTHGNKYDYSEARYIDMFSKVKIICPVHGEFNQKPVYHLNESGCPDCGKDKISSWQKITKEEFVKKALLEHSTKYDYSKVNYINANTKVIITCPDHGDFTQTPGSHVNGNGCRPCSQKVVNSKNSFNTEEFIRRSIDRHGDRYNYSKVEYSNCQTKVTIICEKHGEFYQTPDIHLSGHGCPRCSESKGEAALAKIFDDHGIRYIREYKLPQAPQYRFEYDFYLPDHGLLIEFHGVQHYRHVEYFGNIENFKQTQFRDKVKFSLAKECGYRIIYFNYKDIKKRNILKFESKVLKRVKK